VEPVADQSSVSYRLETAEVSMSRVHPHQLKLTLVRALLIAALPTACAVGVEPDMSDQGVTSDAGTSAGGTGSGGLAGASTTLPKAGAASTNGGGSVTNAFGGTASGGGKAGSSTGGSASAGGSKDGGSSAGGSSAGGSSGGGSGGSAGNSGGGAGTGGGTGSCACKQTHAWADNTNISWVTGDCLTVGSKTYLYTGMKMQTWANKDCNPGMQLVWCTDSGNDYKFMACN
jgi:hypothetical protein